MKLYACRKNKKNGEGNYLCIETRAEWGRMILTFDVKTILQLLPYGVDHRTLTAEGIEIGALYE